MGAIFRREMGAFFNSPIAYIFLGVFYLMSGFFFLDSTIYFGITDMSGVFSQMFLIIVFLIPLMTMKLFSEERKQKTDQGLLTAPVSITAIVFGKYFAALVLYTIGISIFLFYALIIEFLKEAQWATVLSNVVAFWLLGAAFIAVSLFISTFTENQIVSAVLGFLALLFLYLLDLISYYTKNDIISGLVSSISFYRRYSEFVNGLFNLSSVLFYVSVAVLFNFFSVRMFERRRWN